jgi:hypothetical protein
MLGSRSAIHTAAAGLVLAAAGSPTIAEARPADGAAPTLQASPQAPTSVPIEQAGADSGPDWPSVAVGSLRLLALVLLLLLICATVAKMRRTRRAAGITRAKS